MARKITICSNFERLEGTLAGDYQAQVRPLKAQGLKALARSVQGADVVLVNVDSALVLRLCLLAWLSPTRRWQLVWVDPILVPPRTLLDRLTVALKRLLLQRVDRFVLYFRDYWGYRKYYGMNPERVTYIPFKVNAWDNLSPSKADDPEGDVVLTAGRSRRDIATSVAAMRQLPDIPAVFLHQRVDLLEEHGTRTPTGQLPENVRSVTDEGGAASWLAHLRQAKVVVIPLVRDTIAPSGISTYLEAMALWKCVIITESPGTRGLLNDEAVIVPPEDAEQLAAAIRKAWDDSHYRRRVAAAGRRYAERLQGEPRLLRDLLTLCGDLVSKDSPATSRAPSPEHPST